MQKSNKELKEIKKEYIKLMSGLVGPAFAFDKEEQDAYHAIWNFIESTISQTRQEVIEEVKKIAGKKLDYSRRENREFLEDLNKK